MYFCKLIYREHFWKPSRKTSYIYIYIYGSKLFIWQQNITHLINRWEVTLPVINNSVFCMGIRGYLQPSLEALNSLICSWLGLQISPTPYKTIIAIFFHCDRTIVQCFGAFKRLLLEFLIEKFWAMEFQSLL